MPHSREWMDSGSEIWVRRLTIMGPTQIAKTEAAYNIVGFYLQHRPCPMMLVMSKEATAIHAVRRRLLPMIRLSHALRAELTGRKNDARRLDIVMRRATLHCRSAQSPSDLASIACKVVVCDETEKWTEWSGDEASPLALVEERQRTYFDRLLVAVSTPKLPGGIIEREFERGDQRRYHVPCPHCNAWIVFEWEQVKWDREKADTERDMDRVRDAWYECQACGGKVDDRAKFAACDRGVWVPAGWEALQWMQHGRANDRAEHRSYHIWAAYSPWLRWWQIVLEYLKSKDTPQLMMNFVNSWLARTWTDAVSAIGDEVVRACVQSDRKQGEVPSEVLHVTAAVDVQKDRLEYTVLGWGLDEESWVICAGKIDRMADSGDWRELAGALFNRTWGERKLRLCCVLVDRRYRGDEVLEFVRRYQPVARMIAGIREGDSPTPFTSTKIDKHPRTGQPLERSLLSWTVNVGWFKDVVAARMAKATEEGTSTAGRIWLPCDLPSPWLLQLSSEHKVRDRRGRMQWQLKPGHRRNEAWDMLVYLATSGAMMRMDTLRSPDRALPGQKKTPAPAPPPRRPRPGGGFPKLGGRR